ncbi:unnamed protein product [Parajaminaea phylloscopi]
MTARRRPGVARPEWLVLVSIQQATEMLFKASLRRFPRAVVSLRSYSSSRQAAPVAFLDYDKSPDSQAGITLLTLNRPEAKNAINLQMLSELDEAVARLPFDGRTRTLIINSAVTGAFCAGADLKERRTMDAHAFRQWHARLGRTFRAIGALPFPVIAAMDGLALGGGLELALQADLRVAGPGATKLGLPETRHAIIPGAGGTQVLPRLIGPAKAKYLIMSGKIFHREYAHSLGIVDELAESGQSEGADAALRRAFAIAEEFGRGGPLALRAAKAAINKGIQMDINTAYDWEKACYETLFETHDRQEGLNAFAEKRAARYEGR